MNKELRPICVYMVHKICIWLQTRHVTEMLMVIGTLTNNEEELHTHAAHGVHATPIASPDKEVRVAPYEMVSYANQNMVWQEAAGVSLEGFDTAENVIPSSTVQANRKVPQLIEDLIHLKHSWNCFIQHSCP